MLILGVNKLWFDCFQNCVLLPSPHDIENFKDRRETGCIILQSAVYAYVLLFAKVKVQNPPLCCPKRIVTTRQEEWNCFWKERAITQACKVRLVDTWHRTRLQKRVGKLWSVRLKGSLEIVILAFFCCLVLHSCGEFIDQCGVEELCFLKGSKQKIGLVLINHLCIMWRLTQACLLNIFKKL